MDTCKYQSANLVPLKMSVLNGIMHFLMNVLPSIRSINVAVPQLPDSCPYHDKPLGSMQREHQRALESAVLSLRGALAEASQSARSAVAMALHPR